MAVSNAVITDTGRPQGRAAALAGAVVVVAVVVTWLANLPHGAGAGLTAVGQLTGFGCSICALVAVTLMARIPVVTNVVGSDNSVRWHRWASTATVVLLAVHVVTLVAGYAAADKASAAHEISTLVTTYPWMLSATVAAVIMVAVAVTSVRRARSRMKYETWLFAHWYIYPALFLAFGHEITDGASFVHATMPTLAWTWLHLVVACALVWYRVLVPARQMAAHPMIVEGVHLESKAAVTVTLAGRRLDEYGGEAGQHIRIRFLTRNGWWQSHPFSFSAAPTSTRWRITAAVEGDFTSRLRALRPGTRAVVSGVYGSLTVGHRRTRRVLLVGGGSGITPLRALLEAFPAGTDVRVVYRARTPDDLMLKSELDALAAARGNEVDYLLGRRSADPRQDVISPPSLRALVPDAPARDAYVCGRSGFVDAVVWSLRANGVPEAQIHTERFDV
ncbi:MAG: ferric reductase-like transmembrane domain-containing protein [Acidimicrobiia bacterium]|nr:ferric reductase-like transmembrane domain-containing protein [Acidimicrobiia bacterium]